MSRRRSRTALAALLAAACGPAQERPGIPPRHVLLVTVESLRPDHMSCYQYFRPTTVWEVDPGQRGLGEGEALDDLAAEGVLFVDAYAPAPETAPSLASLMTGRSPLEHGVLAAGDALPEEETTLAEAFAAAGYRTLAFVSGDAVPEGRGFEQGFERFARAEDDVAARAGAAGWLEEADLGDWKPLFAWIHLSGPSLPYDPTPLAPRPYGEPGAVEYASLYTDPTYGGPADGSLEYLERVAAGELPLAEADRRHVVALYDGEVARAANCLRHFFDVYHDLGDQIGAWEDTVLVFAGVTGEALGEHGPYFGHAESLHETALRVPLFVRHPHSLTGQRILSEVVDLADVAPTLLDWFGLPSPPLSGRSLLARTDSYVRREFPARPALAAWRGRVLSLRTPEWRLTWRPSGEVDPDDPGPHPRTPLSLFDHRDGWDERRELSASRPDVVAELRALALRRLEALELGPAGRALLAAEREAAAAARDGADG